MFPLIIDFANPDLLRLFLLILPTTIGLAATQINVAVINRIASSDSGAVSYLDYAFRLLHLPLGLFAIAIATVALPRLSAMLPETTRNLDTSTPAHYGLACFSACLLPSSCFCSQSRFVLLFINMVHLHPKIRFTLLERWQCMRLVCRSLP